MEVLRGETPTRTARRGSDPLPVYLRYGSET
ncbi:hypothetical protein EV192_101388 [Actinocrispum wychmicini]|uniref:Uncharacterized protein n=1 Tax=Actinocrispum wychmicini TaxID=1213861 RepID=A0A4R2JVV8_9PSEU|nr:hypothetical protein EV192_101388 [Actinocrispum wychmicini]